MGYWDNIYINPDHDGAWISCAICNDGVGEWFPSVCTLQQIVDWADRHIEGHVNHDGES